MKKFYKSKLIKGRNAHLWLIKVVVFVITVVEAAISKTIRLETLSIFVAFVR